MNDKLLEWQKVIDLYKEGLTPKEISRKVSFDVRDICHKCREFEILGRLVEPKKCTFRASNALKQKAVEAIVVKSQPYYEVTAKYGISRKSLMDWVRRFRHGGYDELLAIKPRGRPRKMPKSTSRISKGKSEIDRLKEENEYLKAENAYLKKLKALDQEDAGMFGIGQKSSGN